MQDFAANGKYAANGGLIYPDRQVLCHSDVPSRTQQGACSWQGSFPRLYCRLSDKSQPCQPLPPVPLPLRALLKLPPEKRWRFCWPFFIFSWQRRRQAGNGTPFSFPPAFWRRLSCCSASVFSGDTRFPAPDCQAGWPWGWAAVISLSGHGFPPGFIMRASRIWASSPRPSSCSRRERMPEPETGKRAFSPYWLRH